jgi:tripartite-type tricarboxylate transporter receptor subunit TctC
MVHVPYKGGSPAMADLVAGHIPAMFASSSDALPQIRAGTIKALAVSGAARAAQLPEVPTVSESGFPLFKTMTWNGLMAPAKTPKDIVDRLAREIALAAKDPRVMERLNAQGIEPVGNSPDEFAATLAADVILWREAVQQAGVKGN